MVTKYGMTPEHIKKLLPILTAYAEGKTIQYKIDVFDEWNDSTGNLSFINYHDLYRIKPEILRYRQYITQQGGKKVIYTLQEFDTREDTFQNIENDPTFFRWIDDDWIEIKV